MWGYEGLTDYLGPMLAARSGLWTPEQYHEYLASDRRHAWSRPPRPNLASAARHRRRRTWPGLRGRGWLNWRRGTDYYDEGDLLWLEVATIIHREPRQKSIDDFCQAFHGGPNNGPEVKTYTFDELVSALNAIAPFDWAAFFTRRLDSTSAEAPVGGIENGGWKVEFNAEPSKLQGRRGNPGDVYSIGLQVAPDGTVSDAIVGQSGIRCRHLVGDEGNRRQWPRLLPVICWRMQSKHQTATLQPITLLVVVDDYHPHVHHQLPRRPSLPTPGPRHSTARLSRRVNQAACRELIEKLSASNAAHGKVHFELSPPAESFRRCRTTTKGPRFVLRLYTN